MLQSPDLFVRMDDLTQLFDILPIGLALVTDVTQISVNRWGAAFLGLGDNVMDQDNVLSLEFLLSSPQDGMAEGTNPLVYTQQSGKSFQNLECRVVSDSSSNDILCTTVPLRDVDDRLFGAVGMFFTSSFGLSSEKSSKHTSRNLEQHLRRTERLASIGTFAAGLAHEINNPLNNILLCAEYFRKTVDPEVREELIQGIIDSARRCRPIIESILKFARAEKSQKTSNNINQVIADSVELVSSYFEAERLSIDVDFDEAIPDIPLNVTEIEQLIVNLIENGVQASEEKCHIDIRTDRRGDMIRIEVSDDGPGIPDDQLKHVFDPFFSTRRKRGGTGLGLSIVHAIIVGHGGSIWAAKREEMGVSFIFELPIESD